MSRRFTFAVALLSVIAAGCAYFPAAVAQHESDPSQRPWSCTATAWGPAHGHHYMGQSKGDLSWSDCFSQSAFFDTAIAYALQYPTAATAEAAGMHADVNYATGMGTHHRFGPKMNEYLNDPGFDRFNPVFPGTSIDGEFTPGRPEFLQYNKPSQGGQLVGMSWFVRTDNGMPPAGFTGGNDWWHFHDVLCFSPTNGSFLGGGLGEAGCIGRGGLNIYLDDYWMLHAWIVPGMKYQIDVFENHHPCLPSAGAIFDPNNACFQMPPTGGGH